MKKLLLILLMVALHASTECKKPVRNKENNLEVLSNSSIRNVKDYGAAGDGVTDDTDAINDCISTSSWGTFIYFPAGTYLISNTIQLKTNTYGHNHLIGQDEAISIIKLKDNSTGFDSIDTPKPMITCGLWGSADCFNNTIANLTIDAGAAGNAGAIGLRFFSNNAGSVRNVTIKANNGGHIGLDVGYNDMNGPAIISKLSVYGFNTGISFNYSVNSLVFEHIYLTGQKSVGFSTTGQSVTIRDLTSVNTVPAVRIGSGNIAIIDSNLTGGNSEVAIEFNKGTMFARNITTSGYKKAMHNGNPASSLNDRSAPESAYIDEWYSATGARLFENSPLKSLNLEIKNTPYIPFGDLSDWVNVKDFGALGDNNADDAAAFQAALNSGKGAIYIPTGTYRILQTVSVPATVKRIIGFGSSIRSMPPITGDEPVFKVVEYSDQPVIFEYLRGEYGSSSRFGIQNASARTVVVQDAMDLGIRATGTGDTFVDDACSRLWVERGAKIWGRQINSEVASGINVLNDGGFLWILGLKTERGANLIVTDNGGETELIGGFLYMTENPNQTPAFVVKQGTSPTLSKFSIAGVEELTWGEGRNAYRNLVTEERYGEARTLLRDTQLTRNIYSGTNFSLYAGYVK